MDAIPVNDLRRALASQAPELREVVDGVLSSGWLVHGPHHTAFENELASYVGARGAVGVASGSDALELAMRCLMPPGRRIVVTVANAGGYSTVAARRAGFEVRYCDVDAQSHCVDAASLESVMDGLVGVVVVTHLYGRLADVDAVRVLARRWGAAVLEDCAQAIGATCGERCAGSMGDAAAFSFYPTKNLGALGDAGAVTSDDQQVLDRIRELRQYGWGSKYRVVVDGGRNSRLDELQAAVLRFRLPRLAGWNEQRREIIAAYAAAAASRVRVLPARDTSHAGHLAVLETPAVEDLMAHLRLAGVGFDVHYPVPDHQQMPFVGDHAIHLPVTEHLARRILTVPCFPELRDDEVERVCDALRTF